MAYTERLNEQLAIVGTIDPDAYAAIPAATAVTVATDIVDMRYAHRVMFVVLAGTIGAAGTIDFAIQQGTNATTATTAIVPACAITTMVTGDSDEQVVVEVEGQDLTPGYRYVRGLMTLSATAGTAAIDVGAIVLADTSRYKAARDTIPDLASVSEFVNA